MLQRLINWLALTPTEQKVILFLAGALAIGGSIRLYQEKFAPQKEFDYRQVDSAFAAFGTRLRAAPDSLAPAVTETSLLDINSAPVEELTKLPGIGRVLAQRIVDERAASGAFASIEQLKRVKGISGKVFEKLKPHITIH